MKIDQKIRVCNIYNTPAHYCKSIYKLMDQTFDCKFVFGDDYPSVKKFDTTILRDCSFVEYRLKRGILFIPGILKYAFRPYKYYIITPSTNSITLWILLFLIRINPFKKIFTWTHGMYGNETKRQLFFKKLQYYLSDGEFVYGDYAIELMKKKGYSEKKLFPIHNSLDYDSQKALRGIISTSNIYSEYFNNNYPVLLMIGRLNKRKRLPMLIEAASMLEEKGVKINVVFIGEGEDRDNLNSLAKEKNISDRVWFYGECYEEKKNAELIYNADLCVMPGDIGLTAIHALMFGLPVVTHNYFPCHGPEFEVIKPGVTGDFFTHDDVGSLVTCLYKWLTTQHDREQIRRCCYGVIDQEWNPEYQLKILKSVLV